MRQLGGVFVGRGQGQAPQRVRSLLAIFTRIQEIFKHQSHAPHQKFAVEKNESKPGNPILN
jgi:hypothetical protein